MKWLLLWCSLFVSGDNGDKYCANQLPGFAVFDSSFTAINFAVHNLSPEMQQQSMIWGGTGNTIDFTTFDLIPSTAFKTFISSSIINPPVEPPQEPIVFVKEDTSTKGDWFLGYGTDGYSINSYKSILPAYAELNILNSTDWIWEDNTADNRGLFKMKPIINVDAVASEDRIASCWFSGNKMTFEITFKDKKSHKVSLYMVDWDTQARKQLVEVYDKDGDLVDARMIQDFNSGEYLTWKMNGKVKIAITSKLGPNAVVSGIFFE